MPVLYGLKTCDTCRKAIKALEDAGQDVTFRDVRTKPLDDALIARFIGAFADALINKRSTTWRGLSETERSRSPEALLVEYPALMKRPVIDTGRNLTLGWDKAVQLQHLG